MSAHWHIPPPVEVQPSPTGISAVIWLPFLGLIVGLALYRAIKKSTRRSW